MLPNTPPPADPPDALPDADRLFETFRATRSSQEMLALAAAAPDDALDALEQDAGVRLTQVEGDEAGAIRQRLENLRALRTEQAEAIHQMRDLARQLAEMPEDQRLLAMFSAATDTADIMRLVAETGDAALDGLEAAATAKLAEVAGDEREALEHRLDDLRRWHANEQDARRTLAPLGDEGSQALAGRLVAWIQTPDWEASQAFLREHTAELLSDAGAAALDLLQLANPGNEQIATHRQLLRFAREHGIDAAYEQLQRELAAARQMQDSPLLQAITEFVNAESEDVARSVLESRSDLLLTADARSPLAQLVEAARQQGDAAAQARLEARSALWHAAWREQTGGPLRRRDQEQWQAQPETAPFDRLERQTLAGERGAKYTVVTAVNSAIGDNARVLNIYDVGDLPLAWSRPLETRPDLAATAVGRGAELDELHRRLQEGDVALVGVRGLAGVGKTVLAAMYATRYADRYPGGVIWLNVGPRTRNREDVTPLLKRLAAYAYSRDLRVAWLDQLVFEPDAVQMLLGGHDRLLLVFDDVWSQEVVAALRAVAPPGSGVLLTTRDRRVAYALSGGPDAIQELDVLTPTDARALLQKRAPGLPDALAGAVASGLGRHAQALALAGAALYLRKPHRYAATAEELLTRVARGDGFGNLPDLDEADAETDVEIALKYTYDYLGEDREHGPARRACFRGLGAFAQEASFDAAAAAGLWQTPPAAAEELLLLFDHLALIREQDEGGCWQQHAILRAYALSLQKQDERLDLAERHAEYYVGLAEACYRAKPRDDIRMNLEFKQIEHAFEWCQRFSPARLLRLRDALNDFMMNHGRSSQLGAWSQAALVAAQRVGDQGRTANTLQSLGDLERRLGNVDAARRHYDAALRLYRLEQEPGGIINTLVSQARLEVGNGNVELAKPLYEEAFRIADQTGFANHPVVQEMRREYEGIRGMTSIRDNPLAAALSALLQVTSDQELAQALADHPILRETDALFALAGLLNQALAAQQNEAVARLMVFPAVLMDGYNRDHSEQIDVEAHQAVIGLYEQVIPLAEQIEARLAAGLRQQFGWACNTLANHFADDGENQDLDQAVVAYTRGLAFDPANAMLLRNRAGVHLDRGDPAAAQADIEAAASLEPDALRLAELRTQLEQLRQTPPGATA